jgi:indolepyruvate ferredoxin oxidoreductase alpha subunit
MTGGQDSSALGIIESVCRGVGVEPEHIHVLNPLKRNHDEMVKIMSQELAYNGVSVLIPRRECIQKTMRKRKSE